MQLTDEETENALAYFRMLKGRDLEEKQKMAMRAAKKAEWKRPFSYDELKSQVLAKAEQLPFKFVIDENNERVFHLLLLYFTNDPLFNQEWIEYSDGTRRQLSLSKGIGLISLNKGTGKSVLMDLFQNNRRQPFLLIETKDLAGAYKKKGEEVITVHSDMLNVAPLPIFNFWEKLGICYNDLGYEKQKGNYGDKAEVMEDILFGVYSKFQKVENGFSNFHFTSNKSGAEFKSRFSDTLTDRLREMFNLIIMPGESRRK